MGFQAGSEVVINGFLGKRKDMSSNLSFCDIDPKGSLGANTSIQIVSNWQEESSIQHDAHQVLKNIPAYSPVTAIGRLEESKRNSKDPLQPNTKSWDLKLRHIRCLNPFPKDIIVSKDAVWPPKSRHLQLRFDPYLHDRLKFRDIVQSKLTSYLRSRGFIQVETPILFKSTPEGAREFLVPTRRQGYAYALPQSPQQYKQILMAGGIPKYFQFAKCFRDEDHRADRQPEFTQLDLEMAFASGDTVVKLVTGAMRSLFEYLHDNWILADTNGARYPVFIGSNKEKQKSTAYPPDFRYPKVVLESRSHMTYQEAMTNFGSDKPDLRIRTPHASNIILMRGMKLTRQFIKMITNLEDPLIQACKFRLDVSPGEAGKFIRKFMDALPNTTIKLSPESTPAVFVYDSSKPLNGLSALGHEAAESVEQLDTTYWSKCEDGDIIIMHAKKNEPFYGGSTELGKLRTAIYEAAVQQGLVPKDNSFRVTWVHSFPLFTPTEAGDEPGQGGTAGFSSTHHPFTAPLTPQDLDLLKKDPLKVRADHYDLVINGVEVGGGSRRIHIAEVQEYIMRDILKMTDEGVSEFAHLLEALRAGCPPHAGFAFGFDRLLTVLLDLTSVKDVIAFPKSNKGEDLMVGSPAKVLPEQQKIYHIFGEPEE
ncbi:hypothetical protein M426DRAFT_14601 [Hypoxylon sp. CI-4A]|nr:hypothetical protein M426DRAFT_14601 [Hypoxylon sp. CI-4A]